MSRFTWRALAFGPVLALSAACGADEMSGVIDLVKDPTAPRVAVDRFSPSVGMLFV